MTDKITGLVALLWVFLVFGFFLLSHNDVTATIAPTGQGIQFIHETFDDPFYVDDMKALQWRELVLSDWLEISKLWRGALEFTPTSPGDYQEVLGPYARDRDQYFGYAIMIINFPEPEKISLTVTVLDRLGNELIKNAPLSDTNALIDLTSIDHTAEETDEIYFVFNYRVKEKLKKTVKMADLHVSVGDSKDYYPYQLMYGDIAYADDHERQMFDIYRAPNTNNRAPWVIFAHGWGYTKWTRRINTFSNELFYELLSQWISVVSMNYRFYNEWKTRFPLNYEDVYKALSYMRDHADDYGLNPSETVVRGKSAGWLAMLWASTWNDDNKYRHLTKEDRDLPEIKGMLLYDTPTFYDRDSIQEILWCDTSQWNAFFPYYGLKPKILSRGLFDWSEYERRRKVQQAIEKAKVHTHIDKTDPPAYFSYSEPLYDSYLPAWADCIHSANYGAHIEPYFNEANVGFEMYRQDGGDIPWDPSTLQWEVDFIMEALSS